MKWVFVFHALNNFLLFSHFLSDGIRSVHYRLFSLPASSFPFLLILVPSWFIPPNFQLFGDFLFNSWFNLHSLLISTPCFLLLSLIPICGYLVCSTRTGTVTSIGAMWLKRINCRFVELPCFEFNIIFVVTARLRPEFANSQALTMENKYMYVWHAC